MKKEIYEALKRVIGETRLLKGEKWGNRKRLNQDEIWRTANLIKDMTDVENWIDNLYIDEVAGEYKEE